MALFVWSSAYSVNVKKCDLQHQRLFEIVDQLAEAMRVGKAKAVIQPILAQLTQYTRSHFADEEQLMRQAGYPLLASHQEQHRLFIARMEEFGVQFGRVGNVNTVALLSTLKDWLVNHIMRVDKAYASHLNASGIR